jgi:hypothetical protein
MVLTRIIRPGLLGRFRTWLRLSFKKQIRVDSIKSDEPMIFLPDQNLFYSFFKKKSK